MTAVSALAGVAGAHEPERVRKCEIRYREVVEKWPWLAPEVGGQLRKIDLGEF